MLSVIQLSQIKWLVKQDTKRKGGFSTCWEMVVSLSWTLLMTPFWLATCFYFVMQFLPVQTFPSHWSSIGEIICRKTKRWDSSSRFSYEAFFYSLRCIHWSNHRVLAWMCDSPVFRMLKHDLSSLLIRCVYVLHVCMDAAFCQLLLWEWFSLLLICVREFIVVALCSPSSYTLLFPFVFLAFSVHVRMQAEDSIQCKKQSSH